MPVGQFWAVFRPAGGRRTFDWERTKAEINRRRAAKGLPPMRPRGQYQDPG